MTATIPKFLSSFSRPHSGNFLSILRETEGVTDSKVGSLQERATKIDISFSPFLPPSSAEIEGRIEAVAFLGEVFSPSEFSSTVRFTILQSTDIYVIKIFSLQGLLKWQYKKYSCYAFL